MYKFNVVLKLIKKTVVKIKNNTSTVRYRNILYSNGKIQLFQYCKAQILDKIKTYPMYFFWTTQDIHIKTSICKAFLFCARDIYVYMLCIIYLCKYLQCRLCFFLWSMIYEIELHFIMTLIKR